MSAIGWTRCLALLSLLAIEGASAANNGTPLADKVRAANSRIKDASVAAAEGYAPIPCASGIDGGAMGVHYVTYLKGEAPEIKRPQAVTYEPLPNGKLELVAVEYTRDRPQLEGQLFSCTNGPVRYGLGPFYESHLWAWKANPRSAFADVKPHVTCEHAH